MTKEDLLELKEKISKLSDEELKKRDLYLRKLANGELQGPPVGYPSIDKPWLKFYSQDAISCDIPKMKAYDYVYENNKSNLDKVAIEYFGKKVTFREIFNNIDSTLKSFRSIGVKKGDVVTVAMATTPEIVYILYSLNRIGAIVNAIDPRLSYDEIKSKIESSNSKVFIGLDMIIEKIENNKKELGLEEIIGVSPLNTAPLALKLLGNMKSKKKNNTSWENFIKNGKGYKGILDEPYEENESVIILYTGGTTGSPKGVVLTNENLNTMALTQIISDFNLARGDIFLNFLPPFSAYSIVNAIHDPLCLGFRTVLVPKFEPSDFPKLMAKYKPNHVLSGPILWEYMMKDEKYSKTDLSNLKSPISGGDYMSPELEKALNDYLNRQGCRYKVQQGYGMTEVSAAASYSSEVSYSPGSVGIPYVKNLIAVFDDDNNELNTNEVGKIKLSTPTMMKGYHNNKIATDEIIMTDHDGKKWIETGDLGRINENGNLYIVGRIKRMIVRSGNKIFPSNVENKILEISGIEKCCIVSMPDEKEKKVPVAYVVLNENCEYDFSKLSDMIDKKILSDMAEFNLPKKIIIKDELLITDMSKIDFKSLEEEALDYVGQNSKVIDSRENKKIKLKI